VTTFSARVRRKFENEHCLILISIHFVPVAIMSDEKNATGIIEYFICIAKTKWSLVFLLSHRDLSRLELEETKDEESECG